MKRPTKREELIYHIRRAVLHLHWHKIYLFCARSALGTRRKELKAQAVKHWVVAREHSEATNGLSTEKVTSEIWIEERERRTRRAHLTPPEPKFIPFDRKARK